MSQADQLLKFLKRYPGEWISTAVLLYEVPCIVHSRISDLRARGAIIEHRTTGKGAHGSEYRWRGTDRALEGGGHMARVDCPVAGAAAATAPLPSSVSTLPDVPSVDTLPIPGQMELVA